MTRRRSVWLLAWLSAYALGCGGGWVLDPALQASVAPVGFRMLPDGAVQLGDWTLVTWTSPAVVSRPHPRPEGPPLTEVHSSLTLRDPDGATWTGDCQFRGRDGTVATSAHSSMECHFEGPAGAHELLLSGNNEANFFALRSVQGDAHGPALERSRGPQPGEPTTRERYTVTASGSPRGLNFYRSREDARYAEGEWRTSCCTPLDPVAAISVFHPEALYVLPDLDPALRIQVMLTVGALVSVRDVSSVPVMD